jgi:hypothetical protein
MQTVALETFPVWDKIEGVPRMDSEQRLILGFIPLDCHWVVLNPDGRILRRYPTKGQAQELFDALSEMRVDWSNWNFDISAFQDDNDLDLDKEYEA